MDCIHRRARKLWHDHVKSREGELKEYYGSVKSRGRGFENYPTYIPCGRDILFYSDGYCKECKTDNPEYKKSNNYFLC